MENDNLPAADASPRPCARELKAESACMVTFGYSAHGCTNGKEGFESFTIFVPDNLLWSAEGLAYLFNSARDSYLANPSKYQDDETVVEAWQSFHVIKIEESDGFVIDGIETPEYRERVALGREAAGKES